jgi:hypothetical protein
MLYSTSSQSANTQRIQVTARSTEIRRVIGGTIMVIRLSASSKNTRGLQGNRNAKPAVTPHWSNMVMVRQTRKRNNWELERTRQIVHRQLQVNLQMASINQRTQSLHPKIRGDTSFIHTTLEYNKIFSRRCLRQDSN